MAVDQIANDYPGVPYFPSPATPSDPSKTPPFIDPSQIASIQGDLGIEEWFSLGYMDAEYALYRVTTTYDTDLGLRVAPQTSQATSPSALAFVPQDENIVTRVRRQVTVKIVTWSARRYFVKPQLPHWNTGNANEFLLKRSISLANPLQSINHKIWEVTGTYIYGFKKEPFYTSGGVEYFVLPTAMPVSENWTNGTSLHAYGPGDFSFVPLDSSFVPVNPKDFGDLFPAGFANRTGIPDPPRQTSPAPIRIGIGAGGAAGGVTGNA